MYIHPALLRSDDALRGGNCWGRRFGSFAAVRLQTDLHGVQELDKTSSTSRSQDLQQLPQEKFYRVPSQITVRMWSIPHLSHGHALSLRTSQTCRIQQNSLLRSNAIPVPRQRPAVKYLLGQKRCSNLCLAATNPSAKALRAEIEELQEERELALRTGGCKIASAS